MFYKVLEPQEVTPYLLHQIEKIDKEGLASYLQDPFTFVIVVLLNDDYKLLGVAFSRVVEEYKIILDPELSNREKALAIKEWMSVARDLTRCNEVVVFVTQGGEHYENFLKKHFNFKKREGTPLMLDV
jgi:hypothetical protein